MIVVVLVLMKRKEGMREERVSIEREEGKNEALKNKGITS